MIWVTVLVGVVFFVLAVLLVHVFIIHPMLGEAPSFSQEFKDQATKVQKFQAVATGWKTKGTARLITICGVLVAIYDTAVPLVAGQDWSPITKLLPDWVFPLGLVVIGIVFEMLRRYTANPPTVVTERIDGEKQVVAVVEPPKVP